MPYGRYPAYRRRTVRPRRPATARRTTTRKPPARRKTAPAFRKRVLAVVRTQNEVKERSVVLTAWTDDSGGSTITYQHANIWGNGLSAGYLFTSGNGYLIPDLLRTIPVIQGTSNQQRIGNQINVKSLTLRGFLTTTPFSTNFNPTILPFEVHMIVYKRKNDPLGSPAHIKNYTDNTNGGITGTAANSMLPWNTDNYRILKHRVFRMKPPNHTGTFQNSPTLAPVNVQQAGSSNNPMFRRFAVNIPVASKFRYNDPDTVSEQKYPVNDYVSVGFYCISGDGNAFSALSYPAQVYLTATLKYTDP